MWVSKGALRVLDFDIENRPLSYAGADWTSAEVTAVAWSWVGSSVVKTLLLQPNGTYSWNEYEELAPNVAFERFASILKAADLVTGHYVRGHDLPILNSAMIENGLPPLGDVLVQDTKCDLVKRKDLSASQENLASLLGLSEAKHHMTQAEWRKANRLTADGIAAARKRVVDDVLQHMALRSELIARRLLKPPRRWSA